MNADPTSPSIERFWSAKRVLIWTAVTLVIALLLFRIPESPGSESNSPARMLLDLSFRPEGTGSMPMATLDGPLVPLQHPIYVGRSIWRTVLWQIGSNLAMAGIVAGSAFRLTAARAWWALSLFVILGIFDSSLAPWVTLFVLGMHARRSQKHLPAIAASIGVGIFAASSIAHFLLAVGIMAWPIASTESVERNRQPLSALAFLGGFLGTWLVLGQSLMVVAHWVSFGFLSHWTPSALDVPGTTTSVYPIAGLTATGWLALVFFHRKSRGHGAPAYQDVWLVTWALALAWKFRAIQAGGSPLLFFATAVLGGFLLLPRAPLGAGAIIVLGLSGAALPDKMLFGDAVGRVNRQFLQNLQEVTRLPSLRDRLRQNFAGYGTSLAMPRVRSVVGNNAVGLLGEQGIHPNLNGFRTVPFQPSDPRLGRGSRDRETEPEFGSIRDVPEFLLQRLDCDSDLFPPLRRSYAQLSAYRSFDFALTEQGFSLWKKRGGPLPGAPELIETGEVRFGENLRLPTSDGSLWLELECSPSLLGRVFDQLRPLTEPRIRTIDDQGNELGYAIAWRTARSGFMIAPFFRGDLDLLRFHEGATLSRVASLAVDPPSSWAWRSTIRYRVYRLPALASAHSPNLSSSYKQSFSALNRPPLSLTVPFNPIASVVDDKPAVFIHPNSVMEVLATQYDRIVTGSFGIVPAAYVNGGPNVTDGVSFSIEFIPARGPRKSLLWRTLDPVANAADRGSQEFAIALPPNSGGRLLFRTFNLPYATSSFDWSYWRQIELK